MNAPSQSDLFAIASEQAGYFTTSQAHEAGFSSPLVRYHTRTGRFLHVARGLYRLRDYPSTQREEVLAAWLRLAPKAVVSHYSALDFLGLADVIPDAIHLTVPRADRKVTPLPGVVIHTTLRLIRPNDVTLRGGVRVTSAARTIVDVAELGTPEDQVAAAARSAIERGLTTRRQLLTAAAGRGKRVQAMIDRVAR